MADRPAVNIRFVIRLFLVLVLIGLAWRVLSLGVADAESRTSPEQALLWRTQHSSALFLLAEQQAKNPESQDEARKNALAALRAYPFEGRAYRILGQLADDEKQSPRAFALYQKAIRYTPRDLQSHEWLLNYSLRTGNAEAAVHHLDRLLRMKIDSLPPLLPTIGGLAALPQSQAALVNALTKNPLWREPAIKTLMAEKGAVERYSAFVSRLEKTSGGLSVQERQTWLNALNQNQQWSLAYLNWANQLPAETQLELGNLFNGSFENLPLGSEFDWQFDRTPGASIDQAFREGVEGTKALRVQFDDRRVPFNGVHQTLVLPTGSYRFSGQGLADGLRTELGLVWSIRCLEGGADLATSEAWKGMSRVWQQFSMAFEIPKSQCSAQRLELKLPARIASEQMIGGTVWFDAFRIQRIQALTERNAN